MSVNNGSEQIPEQIQVPLIFGEGKDAFRDGETMNLWKPGNKSTTIARPDYTFLGLMKPILNFYVAFKWLYCKKIIAPQVLDVLKVMKGTDFKTGMSM